MWREASSVGRFQATYYSKNSDTLTRGLSSTVLAVCFNLDKNVKLVNVKILICLSHVLRISCSNTEPFSDIQNLFSCSHFVEWRFLLWVSLRTRIKGHCRVAMTAVWRSQKHQAVRVHQGQDWVPFHSQRTTTKGLRRMAVLVRQSIWKMVGANTTFTHIISLASDTK